MSCLAGLEALNYVTDSNLRPPPYLVFSTRFSGGEAQYLVFES